MGGCPNPPIVAGTILVLSNVPGGYCVGGLNVTVDCEQNELHDNAITGYANDGSDPCIVSPDGYSEGCLVPPDYVEPQSWSRVKHLYR